MSTNIPYRPHSVHPKPLPAWFKAWYDNKRRDVRIDDGDITHRASILVRHLAQPTSLEVRTHTHLFNVRSDRLREGMEETLRSLAVHYVPQIPRRTKRLDVIVADGQRFQCSKEGYYAILVKEVYP